MFTEKERRRGGGVKGLVGWLVYLRDGSAQTILRAATPRKKL